MFRLFSSCSVPLNNYMNFNDTEGIYTYCFEAEKKVSIEGYNYIFSKLERDFQISKHHLKERKLDNGIEDCFG